MENALLYTFSTIAQTIGGAIALVSAFVLYRFSSLDTIMLREANLLRASASNAVGVSAELERLEGEGDYQLLLDKIKDFGDRFHIPAFKRLKHQLWRKNRIIEAFKRAAYSTGATMLLSVGLLPFSHFLASQSILAAFLLAATLLCFILTVGTYWLIISIALGINKLREREVS